MSYNGWENYETWAVALWIKNDQGSYTWSREMAADCLANVDRSDTVFTPEQNARGDLAERLKEWHEEMMPDLGASLWADLLGAAFGSVDWYEIAENYLSEMEEE
jgi:hypothetical protein